MTDGREVAQDAGEPIVSVIIASYNSMAFLGRCVGSVLDQTLSHLEIIIVDDASTDDSLAFARAIASRQPRVRVDALPVNGGPGAARNRAIAMARGQWIAIVDSDDLLHPERLATLVGEAEAAAVDIVADDLLVFDDGSDAAPARFLKAADRAGALDIDLEAYLRRSPLYGAEPNLGFLKPLIRREPMIASGVRYDETLRIAEDDDLIARLLLAGLKYRVLPVPLYLYRKHGTSISHRLSVGAMTAMCRANARLETAILARRSDLARVCAARRRSFERVAVFEAAIADLKQRRVGAALSRLARSPSALPLLRMPLAGLIAKVRPRAGHVGRSVAPSDEMAVLIAQVGLARAAG